MQACACVVTHTDMQVAARVKLIVLVLNRYCSQFKLTVRAENQNSILAAMHIDTNMRTRCPFQLCLKPDLFRFLHIKMHTKHRFGRHGSHTLAHYIGRAPFNIHIQINRARSTLVSTCESKRIKVMAIHSYFDFDLALYSLLCFVLFSGTKLTVRYDDLKRR